MNKYSIITLTCTLALLFNACQAPPPQEKRKATVKHNYIVLLDLSDRLIVQQGQPARDKQIIQSIYKTFEKKVKKEMYIKARDEIKVVIAPQRGSKIQTDIYEDDLYINMEKIAVGHRNKKEEERRTAFYASLDNLYKEAVFSKNPKAYFGADIWKYFYEDLVDDYADDTLTKNFLFILTDGYPIVGKDLTKLQPVKNAYPDLHIVLLEGSPRDKDMEWDRVMELWTKWFNSMNIKEFTFIKRKAISKVEERISDIVSK